MIAWSDVVAHLKPGDTLQPLTGDSKLTVDSIDNAEICIRQRLWRASLKRADMQTANKILAAAPPDVTPIQLAELIRKHYMEGHDVKTECTRVPNLAAIVLYNLGAVPTARPAS